MPKRSDIKSVLIIGAGPIVIGQACEFDYSGVQACKALKEEGLRVILVNSNPATIMTDPGFADATYIEPIRWQEVEKIIEKEQPDVLLPTMGGQTALNCALDSVDALFPELPNPKIVMYIYPHLATRDRVPVPGYLTAFRMYDRTEFALPGENRQSVEPITSSPQDNQNLDRRTIRTARNFSETPDR